MGGDPAREELGKIFQICLFLHSSLGADLSNPEKGTVFELKHLHGRLGVQQKRGRLWTSDCARKGMVTNNNQNQVKQSKAKTQSKTKTPPVFCPLLLKRLQGFAFCQQQKATTTTKITWWFLSSIRTKASYLML